MSSINQNIDFISQVTYSYLFIYLLQLNNNLSRLDVDDSFSHVLRRTESEFLHVIRLHLSHYYYYFYKIINKTNLAIICGLRWNLEERLDFWLS